MEEPEFVYRKDVNGKYIITGFIDPVTDDVRRLSREDAEKCQSLISKHEEVKTPIIVSISKTGQTKINGFCFSFNSFVKLYFDCSGHTEKMQPLLRGEDYKYNVIGFNGGRTIEQKNGITTFSFWHEEGCMYSPSCVEISVNFNDCREALKFWVEESNRE